MWPQLAPQLSLLLYTLHGHTIFDHRTRAANHMSVVNRVTALSKPSVRLGELSRDLPLVRDSRFGLIAFALVEDMPVRSIVAQGSAVGRTHVPQSVLPSCPKQSATTITGLKSILE